jgi:hypothetical protein
MTDIFLLISNPPHATVDVERAAECFGLAPAEVRIRMNAPAAQVWFAEPDMDLLKDRARALIDAGANVRVIRGKSLLALSPRHDLKSFVFETDGMRCILGSDRSIVVPYDWKAVAVSCRPADPGRVVRRTLLQTVRSADRRKSVRQQAKMKVADIAGHTDESFVDLFFIHLPTVRRLTIRPGYTEFSGLGAEMKPVMNENVTALIHELARRFTVAQHDRRLLDAPGPRPITVSGRALSHHLETIDPTLRDLDWYDLLSRLAFLSRA